MSTKLPSTPDEHALIAHLNAATGRRYRVVTAPMRARLRESGLDACRTVIDYLAAEWLPNAKMARYVDTVTPWRPSNFDRYLAAALAEPHASAAALNVAGASCSGSAGPGSGSEGSPLPSAPTAYDAMAARLSPSVSPVSSVPGQPVTVAGIIAGPQE